jgi:hypothetical protein
MFRYQYKEKSQGFTTMQRTEQGMSAREDIWMKLLDYSKFQSN